MNSGATCFFLGCLNILVIALGCSEQSTVVILLGIVLCMLFFGRALYLHLLDTEKGRTFLKKIPLKPIQSSVARYEIGDRCSASATIAANLFYAVYTAVIFMGLGIYNWNNPKLISNTLSYFEFTVAGIFALYCVYLSLFFFKKGRAVLGKLPFKFIKRRLEQFQ